MSAVPEEPRWLRLLAQEMANMQAQLVLKEAEIARLTARCRAAEAVVKRERDFWEKTNLQKKMVAEQASIDLN